MLRRGLGAAAVLVVTAVVGACGTARQKAQTPTAATSSLHAELLSLSDLPTGWRTATFPAVPGPSLPGGAGKGLQGAASLFPHTMSAACPVQSKDSQAKGGVAPPNDTAEVFFDQGHNPIPTLDELLASYPGHGRDAFSFMNEELSHHCSTVSYEVNGRTENGSIQKLSLPTFGDESAGWEIDTPTPGTAFRQEVICLRKSDKLAFIVYSSTTPGDISAAAQSLAEKAAGKLL